VLPQFSLDKRNVLNLFSAMAQPEAKLVTRVSLLIDLILVAAFFTFMFFTLGSHVPSDDPAMISLWSAAGAACLSGVFWLAIQMFRVVLRFQRRQRNH
jgi:hypothetical protein